MCPRPERMGSSDGVLGMSSLLWGSEWGCACRPFIGQGGSSRRMAGGVLAS